MKRGSQVTVKIEKTEFPSVGISEFEGKKLYIKGDRKKCPQLDRSGRLDLKKNTQIK